jgi:hypothetical protein
MGNNQEGYLNLYRMLAKLRITFNIGQKIEFLSENMRKFFGYWLNISSKKLMYLLFLIFKT